MTPLQALQEHRQLCDDLHELALEENRHLQQHRLPPGAGLLDRKRALLDRLNRTLAALRGAQAGVPGTEFRTAVEQIRSRILQILQLDRENEQLLLRCSLASGRPASPAAPPAPSLLQRIYQGHARPA